MFCLQFKRLLYTVISVSQRQSVINHYNISSFNCLIFSINLLVNLPQFLFNVMSKLLLLQLTFLLSVI